MTPKIGNAVRSGRLTLPSKFASVESSLFSVAASAMQEKKMLFYQRFKDKVSTAIRWLNCFRENAVGKIMLQGDLLDA